MDCTCSQCTIEQIESVLCWRTLQQIEWWNKVETDERWKTWLQVATLIRPACHLTMYKKAGETKTSWAAETNSTATTVAQKVARIYTDKNTKMRCSRRRKVVPPMLGVDISLLAQCKLCIERRENRMKTLLVFLSLCASHCRPRAEQQERTLTWNSNTSGNTQPTVQRLTMIYEI